MHDKHSRHFFAASLAAAIVFSPLAYAQTTLTLINEYPATSITATADLNFTEQVKKLSGGSLDVKTLQESDNPYKGVDQVDAVSSGKVQMGTIFGGILGAKDSLFLLSSLPFASKDFKQARTIYECAKPALEERAKSLDTRLLYVTPWPPSGIWSVQPVQSEDDLKSLKIRTYDKTSAAVFQRLGAESVNLPYSALAEKLAANEVNAVLTSGDGGAGRKLWDHLPNFTAVNYSIPLSYTIINNDVWDKLSKEQQSVLTQAAEYASDTSWNGVEKRINANYERMKENKMTLNTAPSESVMAALSRASAAETDAWLKTNKLSEQERTCLN